LGVLGGDHAATSAAGELALVRCPQALASS